MVTIKYLVGKHMSLGWQIYLSENNSRDSKMWLGDHGGVCCERGRDETFSLWAGWLQCSLYRCHGLALNFMAMF